MKPEKTHTETKKILYQLESIIKTLYPHHKTTNPYNAYLESYYAGLNIEDELLFKRLLKSITILNHKERPQDGKRYISSYGDVLTTIELVSQYTINDKLLNSYVQLKEVFLEGHFTKLQASRVLRKSMRHVERLLQLLHHLKLVEKTGIKQGQKHTYRLLGYQTDHYTSEAEGHIDLEYRT